MPNGGALPRIQRRRMSFCGNSHTWHFVEHRSSWSVCSVLTLPPPSDDCWRQHRIPAATLLNTSLVDTILTQTAKEYFLAHLSVASPLTESLAHPHAVHVYPNQLYVLEHPYTVFWLDRVLDTCRYCTKCSYEYDAHSAGICPGWLGESFTVAWPRDLAAANSLVAFDLALPGWVATHADAIYKITFERFWQVYDTGDESE